MVDDTKTAKEQRAEAKEVAERVNHPPHPRDAAAEEAAEHDAAVDAKVEDAKPEEEKVSPEQRHHQRLVQLRDIRDRALVASRHMDHFAMGQAVHDLADLMHRFFDERHPRLIDPLESELVGHHRAPVHKK